MRSLLCASLSLLITNVVAGQALVVIMIARHNHNLFFFFSLQTYFLYFLQRTGFSPPVLVNI